MIMSDTIQIRISESAKSICKRNLENRDKTNLKEKFLEE